MRITEVSLSPAQLDKRDNWDTLVKKIKSKTPLELTPQAAEQLGKTEVVLGYTSPKEHEEFVNLLAGDDKAATLEQLRTQGKTIMLPTADGGQVRLTQIQKTKSFGRTGAKSDTERQEVGIVEAINGAVATNKQKPITVKTKYDTIKDVISANKVTGMSELGKEPYADIAIHTKSGRTYLVSAKATHAPSIAGGGIAGLMNIDKDIVGNAVKRAYKFYKEVYGHAEGKKFPPGRAIEVYIKIADKHLRTILRGTKEMGGPIDFMYIGPMDIESTFENGILSFNGSFINIDTYMKKIGNLFLRIRRRRKTQVLDFESVDKYGFPNIFYQRGEGGRRIVLVSEKDVPASLKKKGKDMWVGLGD